MTVQLLSAKDLAERLSCSKSKAHKMLASGELPVVRLGGCVRVTEDALNAYIKAQTAPTIRSRVVRVIRSAA